MAGSRERYPHRSTPAVPILTELCILAGMSRILEGGNSMSRSRPGVVAIATGGLMAGVLSGCVVTVGADSERAHDAGRLPGHETVLPVSEITDKLGELAVKGRAPKTGYSREEFGSGWSETDSCDTRNRILKRDLINITFGSDGCTVLSGTLPDPYTGKEIPFVRGQTTSDDVQIDHVVSLSNAWQTGARQLDVLERVAFANDPLNLAATEGRINQQKGDADAATWLPPNKAYRCSFVARQVLVKHEYGLWVTPPEHDAIQDVLAICDSIAVPQ